MSGKVRSLSSLTTAVYNPKAFFLHAASLHQGFPHCAIFPTAASRRSLGRVSVAIFPTAASRRSLGRVSVPMWPINLSVRLPIVACGVPSLSSPTTGVYKPKTFFLHAASLHHGYPHRAIIPTAASRRSLGRVSVPMWPINLSVRLPIVALVGRYLTN